MLIARRNLLRDRTRFALSVAAVATSIAVMLLLAGYRSGVYEQSASYLRNAPGDVVVVERGVANFLGTSSVLPAGTVEAVAMAPGVARAVPIVSQFVIFESHDRKDGFVLIGYEPSLGGGPWRLAAGREPAALDELVLDRATARLHDIAVGAQIAVLDRVLTVVGLSDGTTFWAGSIGFATSATVRELLRAPGLTSFILVETTGDFNSMLLAPLGVEAVAKSRVIANDAALMARIYDAPIGLMVAVAFVVGMLVVGVVIFSATAERRREYGALKAIGIRNGLLYRIVAAQATSAALAGAGVGTLLAYAAAAVLMAWRPQFLVVIEPELVAPVTLASLAMATGAALVPARLLARMAPAEVFR